MGKKWTLKEIEILKNNYKNKSKDDLLFLLKSRTWNAIQIKASELQLTFDKRKLTPEQRFWQQVDKKQNNLCWNWIGYYNKNGYGKIKINRKMISTHRFCWKIHFGEISKDLCVLHTCDNPRCVNPNHLFLGTQQDNIKDMILKNRQYHPKGENNCKAKLTSYQVKQIRLFCNQKKLTQTQIGKMFNVNNPTISKIKNNKTWKII